MSKRHPKNPVEPVVAPVRGRRRGRPEQERRAYNEARRVQEEGRRPGRREREELRGPRYRTERLTPDHWHAKGDAVVQGDRPVDVWAGIPGETAEVEMLHTGKNRIVGRWYASVGQPHPLRRDPPCDHFNPCGGCPLMHLNQEGQHRARLAMLRDALTERGLAEHVPDHVVDGPDGDEAYRHIVKLTVGKSDRGHLRIGTFARRTHRVVAIPGCNVATPTLRRVMSSIAHNIIDLDIWPFEPDTGRGCLRHIVMRQSRATGEVLITIVAGNKNKMLVRLAENVSGAVTEVAGVHVHYNEDPGNAIFERDEDGAVQTRPLLGKDLIEETLCGVTLDIGPGDFFQANPGMAQIIGRDLLDLLTPDRSRPVVDLYCGVGGFTLALGRAHGWAFGVEVVGGAVLRARENARRNRISAEFVSGDVAELLPDVATRLDGRYPVVMVDPARRGLGDGVIPGMLALKPARIAYLSCNPRALARDLEAFVAEGWTVSHLRAYDMFPQTAHLETLAILDPPQAPPKGLRPPRRRVVR